MDRFPKVTLTMLLVFAWAYTTLATAADEPGVIRSLISHTFDRPGAPVVSDPIVVERDYALADWVQGNKGGRALLRKKDGKWDIMLCAGDGVKEVASLMEAGLPEQAARSIHDRITRAESGLPSERVKLFGLFRPERAAGEHAEHH